MEQLVLLVIIGLISLVNWLMQKAAEKREAAERKRAAKREEGRNIYTRGAPPTPRPVAPRTPAGGDPFKELMDALGLPSGEPPPPVVVREEVPAEEFASLEEPAPAPPAVPRTPRWSAPPVPRPDEKTARLASAFAAGGEKPDSAYRGSRLRELLAGRDAQRKAVVLAEILGTPRGLSPSVAPALR